MAYVAGVTDPMKAVEASNASRLTSLSESITTLASTTLTKAAAANTYAPRGHGHPIGEVEGLRLELDKLAAALRAATGADLSGYATSADVAGAVSPLLSKVDAANTYAPRAHTHPISDVVGLQDELDRKFIAPASGVQGHVLTWISGGLALAPAAAGADMSTYLLKSDAANLYAAKAHTHSIADVSGLQAALDARLLKADADTRYAAKGAAAPTTERWSMPGTLVVKAGAGRAVNLDGAARTVTTIRADVGTAPTGSGVTVAVKADGSTLATLTIPAGATSATATPTGLTWAAGAALTVDVTAVGSTTAGADLVVAVRAA